MIAERISPWTGELPGQLAGAVVPDLADLDIEVPVVGEQNRPLHVIGVHVGEHENVDRGRVQESQSLAISG